MENIGILFNNLTKHYNSSYIAHPNAKLPGVLATTNSRAQRRVCPQGIAPKRRAYRRSR